MAEQKEDIVYQALKDKLVALHTNDWDFNINMDDLLKIDYSNIFGEIVTIPVLENQVGRLLAEMRNYAKEQKLSLDIKEAEVRKLYRNDASGEGAKKPTLQMEEDHLSLDPVVKNLRYRIIRIQKDVDYLEVLYDAVRSKSFKLNNLSKSLTPEDFEQELLEGTFNNVTISMKKKRFIQK